MCFFSLNELNCSIKYDGSRSQWPRGLKAWVCVRSLAGIAGSNPTGGMDVCRCECYQVEVSAMDRLLVVQRSPTDCGGSECDRGNSQRKPWPTKAVEPWKRDKVRTRLQAEGETEFIRRESWTLRSNHPYHRCWENHENLVGACWWPGENKKKKIKLHVRRFSIGWFVGWSVCSLKVICL